MFGGVLEFRATAIRSTHAVEVQRLTSKDGATFLLERPSNRTIRELLLHALSALSSLM